jgi:hypothetical protein
MNRRATRRRVSLIVSSRQSSGNLDARRWTRQRGSGSTIDEQKGDAPEAVVVVRGRSVPGRLRLRNVLRLRHRESESRSRPEGVSRLHLRERARGLSSLSSLRPVRAGARPEGHTNSGSPPQAARSYSWISPPRTSRVRTTAPCAGHGVGPGRGSGVLSPSPRCGIRPL